MLTKTVNICSALRETPPGNTNYLICMEKSIKGGVISLSQQHILDFGYIFL